MLLGATWVYEGGCMAVRASDQIFRMEHLKGKKIGISKSLNTIKNDWWRIQEHMGIENMLMLNGMTMDDIELVEFPYPDDWYDKPEMLQVQMNNPSELWMRRDHKHDFAFRPLEKALLAGTVDAIYTQSKVFQHLQEATGQLARWSRTSPATPTGASRSRTPRPSSRAPTSWPTSTQSW